MKRRDFHTTVVGVIGGAILAHEATTAEAQGRPDEKRSQIYKCKMCTSVVEILVPGHPALVHCGEPMELLDEKTADKSLEKHVPIVEKIDGGYRVIVGSTPHPMTDAHYIMWIELGADGKTYRQFLNPGDKPEATFPVADAKEISAREYCNLHGLWKGE